MTENPVQPVDLDDSRVPVVGRARRWRPRDLVTAGGVVVALLGSSAGAIALGGGASVVAAPVASVTAATLAGSQSALAKQSTVHYALTARETVDGQSLLLSFSGGVDLVGRSADFRVGIAGISVEERLLGGDLYVKLPAGHPGLPWAAVPLSAILSAAGSRSLAAGTDPAGSLDVLKGLTDVRRVGTQTVDGVPTVHYTGNASAAGRAALFKSSTPLAAGLRSIGSQTLAEDVYIGGDGLVRRLHVAGGLTVEGHRFTLDSTGDFTQFNKPVTVTAPPAGQVRRVSSLAGLAGN